MTYINLPVCSGILCKSFIELTYLKAQVYFTHYSISWLICRLGNEVQTISLVKLPVGAGVPYKLFNKLCYMYAKVYFLKYSINSFTYRLKCSVQTVRWATATGVLRSTTRTRCSRVTRSSTVPTPSLIRHRKCSARHTLVRYGRGVVVSWQPWL